MIPDGYKPPPGKGAASTAIRKKEEPDTMDAAAILDEIRSLKKEIVDDMRELGAKIDNIANGHNDLRLEFVRVTTQQETRLSKLEKDITALWDHNRVMRNDISNCQADINTHKEIDKTTREGKKTTAEWVRWIPGTIFGLIALGLSLLAKF